MKHFRDTDVLLWRHGGGHVHFVRTNSNQDEDAVRLADFYSMTRTWSHNTQRGLYSRGDLITPPTLVRHIWHYPCVASGHLPPLPHSKPSLLHHHSIHCAQVSK